MKITRIGLLCLLLPFTLTLICAQSPTTPTATTPPKREFRGVWIATVFNIDFPARPTTDAEAIKTEWLNLLDFYKNLNFNALLIQVRPSGDALYRSDLAPWSRYLTGKQGVAPSDGFDPLAFMISTAHAKGIEIHAWLNPYRASMDNEEPSQMADNHVLKQHPEWCIKFNKRYIFDPGLPETREHVAQVVEELVRNYDLDAIHFDDYFYPYKNGKEEFRDGASYTKYGTGFNSVEDWRRNNVDLLIEDVSRKIKAIKPRCQFGISPFGVWRNQNRDPLGSATLGGNTCYDDLYADVRKWLQNGWIDYVAPQCYWQMGFSIADYTTLVNWWAANSFGKTVYIGHAAYRVGQSSSREPSWGDVEEIPRQIALSRVVKGVKGSIFFSSKSLMKNPLGLTDKLRNEWYNVPAFAPIVIKDTSTMFCEAPTLKQVEGDGTDVVLSWMGSKQDCKRKPFHYIVYRFDGNKVNFDNPRNILAMIDGNSKNLSYRDKTAIDGYIYTYAISVMDCLNEEQIAAKNVLTVQKEIVTDATGKTGPRTRVKEIKYVDYPDTQKKRRSFWKRLFGCR